MGLNCSYPVPTERMGAMLTVHGIRNSAIIEFGPMGTANYYGKTIASYGIPPKEAHFAVHTTDTDLSLGKYDQLLEAISDVEHRFAPDVIFIFASSLLNVIGVDVEGLVKEASQHTKAPVVIFPGGSLGNSYMTGISDMLVTLCQFCSGKASKRSITYNLLGSIPDDFHFLSDVDAIQKFMNRYFSAKCLSAFPYGCSLQDIEALSSAEVNLVLRSEAIPCAQLLQEKTGTPYLFIRPYGAQQIRETMDKIADLTGWQTFTPLLERDLKIVSDYLAEYRQETFRLPEEQKTVLVSGNYDTVKHISRFLESELGLTVIPRVRASLTGDIPLLDETEWEQLVTDHPRSVIFADGENRMRYGERVAILSHPTVRYRDLCHTRPFMGLNGAINLMQMFDDCRPIG